VGGVLGNPGDEPLAGALLACHVRQALTLRTPAGQVQHGKAFWGGGVLTLFAHVA
jgi:hypothetical protein